MDRSWLESLAERFVEKALSLGFEDAAISIEGGERFMAKYANSRVSIVQSWTVTDTEVYLARAERIYHGSFSARSWAQLEKMLEQVSRTIESMDKSPLYAPLPEPSGKPLQGLADTGLASRMDRVGDYAGVVIDAAEREAGGEARVAGMVEAFHGYRVVATSKHSRAFSEEHTRITGYARVLLGEASGHWAWTSTRLDEKGLESIGRIAGEYAVKAAKAQPVRVERGEYTAILSPLVAGNLLDTMGFMATGLAVLMGFSFLAGKKPGEKIAVEEFTLIDDPHDPLLPGSTGFDDEGMATTRKPIVEKGVLKQLLHNSKTGKALGSGSTGNAGLLMPRPWNLVVEPGDMSLDEMIAETKKGFLVNNNWYTRFQNYYEGVFSTVTRDALLYIENGEVKGRVARLRIASAMPRLLNSIRGIGRERYDVKWWEVYYPTRLPYFLVEGVEFTLPEA